MATWACGSSATAQYSLLDPVVVTGTRQPQRVFDVPASIDSVDGETIRDQQLRVNLSETLGRVPGLLIQNRQNYAQDLQVSSRGFGARSTFGVRGVRLIQDGIPLTMPDGQGQTALFDLDGAKNVEVLRGPFTALYGNASGGVINLVTNDGPSRPTLQANGFFGTFTSWRAGVTFGGTTGALNYTGNVSRFETDGFREHSAARRDLANLKLGVTIDDNSKLTLIGNSLEQHNTQDPLGLTQAQLDENPRQAGTNAVLFNTRKSIDHQQGGAVYERRITSNDAVRILGYGGHRDVVQHLAIPLAAQGLTSSGGVVDLDRDFSGVAAQWRHSGVLIGRPYSMTLGLDYDRMAERRQGFVNNNGTAGALRRDEDDTVYNFDQFLIANWYVADRWQLTAGVRHIDVKFRSDDHFIVGPNPDDSGTARYSRTTPVIGAGYELTPALNVFASVGRGFETPTFVELAYRPDGQPGLNFDLKAATSTNYEAGVKALVGTYTQATAAVFHSITKNEVVAATSSGGRNTFTNANETSRQGIELAVQAIVAALTVYVSYTYTDAVFERFTNVSGQDLSGKKLPGVPRHVLYGEIAWQHPASGFSTALEARAASKLYANDANSAAADSYAAINWRGGFQQNFGGWNLTQYIRVDNVLNANYVGSVIVNEANQRYFEASQTRGVFGGVTASYVF